MGKHILRKDMTCLNCNHVVEKRYCPNCGQENKDTKESFHYLFTHFFEDLTHYDGSFWKTIKYLLFYPAKLSKEYVSGKRQSYLAPVRLYIFISFVTFLLLSVLPTFQSEEEHPIVKVKETKEEKHTPNVKIGSKALFIDYKSVAAFDSIQNALPEAKKLKGFRYWATRKMVYIGEHNTSEEFMEKFKESIFHNLPKVIFLFMPIFAFVLWLFHNKKRWYYYEHGIFTLHYFSMILLSFTSFMLLIWLLGFVENYVDIDLIYSFLSFILFSWWVFYFFRSHSRFYMERKLISRLKCSFIFLINFVLIFLFLIILLAYSALNVN